MLAAERLSNRVPTRGIRLKAIGSDDMKVKVKKYEAKGITKSKALNYQCYDKFRIREICSFMWNKCVSV
jgi:hypothetical protein